MEKSNDETQPLGKKRPNNLRLYDMSGNVSEWVQDLNHDDYNGAPTDGAPWEERGEKVFVWGRVLRGGSWDNDARDCRAASRGSDVRGESDRGVCFRLARTI